MSAWAEIILVSRNRTISLLRFFEAFRRWLIDYLTCVRLWTSVVVCQVFKDATNTQNKSHLNGCFFSPGWNYLRLHAAGLRVSARAEISVRVAQTRPKFQPGLEFWSCNRLLCFNRILFLGRAEISARETGLKTLRVISP